MKSALENRRIKKLIWLSSFLVLLGCTNAVERDYRRAKSELEKGHHRTSISYFEKVIKMDPTSEEALDSSRTAAKVSSLDLKDSKKTLDFLRHIIMYSPNNDERIQAQKQLANIYFENLQDYQKANVEYNKLLQFPHTDSEAAEYRIALARSNFFLNQFYQADSELNEILKLKISVQMRFNALILKSNILIAQKQYAKAITLLKEIIAEFPDLAEKERVAMTLAVCYEESQDYAKALGVLEGLKGHYSPPEYIELRIKRIKERQRNQPGAKGFRK